MNLSDLKTYSKYDYIISDINNNLLKSGDFVLYIRGTRIFYYLIEYVKYINDTILIFHSRYSSYYSTPVFKISGVYEYTQNENLLKIENNKIPVQKIEDNIFNYTNQYLSKLDLKFFKKISKAIYYRSRWNNLPELKVQSVAYFPFFYPNETYQNYLDSYVKLCNGKHEEYIWYSKAQLE